MTLRGNRGEWSEVLCLLDLLAEGKVPVFTEVSGEQEGSLQVEAVYRFAGSERIEYSRKGGQSQKGPHIRIWPSESGATTVVKLEDVQNWRNQLRGAIRSSTLGSGTFTVDALSEAFELLRIRNLASSGAKKADLAIDVRSVGIDAASTVTLSIKSYIGSNPTLLNASRATGINFLIRNAPLDPAKLTELNRLSVGQALKSLLDADAEIQMLSYSNSTFQDNLRMLDSDMDSIWALIVLESYLGPKKISEVARRVASRLSPEYGQSSERFVRAKLERLLEASALGMRPSEPWDGLLAVDGGYLIVDSDAELSVLLNKNVNQLRRYLYTNTAIDYPSKKRHAYGTFALSTDALTLQLNAQIRFTRPSR